MQIVIDIPDGDYEYIKNGCIVPIKYDNHIYNAIRNGTPLPKRHGRLIDADIAIQTLGDENEDAYAEYVLNDAPTIIEADRGEE